MTNREIAIDRITKAIHSGKVDEIADYCFLDRVLALLRYGCVDGFGIVDIRCAVHSAVFDVFSGRLAEAAYLEIMGRIENTLSDMRKERQS